MGTEIKGYFIGDKQVRLVHGPTGAEFITDAPPDNTGKGRTFSPTDLVGASIGSCMLTIISIIAERGGIDVSGMWVTTLKEMSEQPRRIKSLPITIHLPQSLSEEWRRKFEAGARSCPVHHSLHPDINSPLEFVYDV